MIQQRLLATYIGIHQQAIDRHFSGDTRYNDEQPLFDFPLVILCFTNRCGSNMLAEHLRLTGGFFGFREQLNHDIAPKVATTRQSTSFPMYIKSFAEERPNESMSFGIKASWDQLLMLLRWNIPNMFSGIHVIHVEREDIVAQAVSFSIADQTKKWTSLMAGEEADPVYNFADILDRLNGIGHGNRLIKQLCSIYELNRVHVAYENIISNPVMALADIHRQMNLPFRQFNLNRAKLEKQADESNLVFADRFMKDFKERLEIEA